MLEVSSTAFSTASIGVAAGLDARISSLCERIHSCDELSPTPGHLETPGCLEQAAEVEDLFGPMPHFDQDVGKAIGLGVLLVVGCETKVHGAALLGRDDEPHRINWLSVPSR